MSDAVLEQTASEGLSDEQELLFRQVHPSFVRDGRPSSQAFRPTAKDEGKLSVARASLTTAEAAFELHPAGLGLHSAGTWAITVGECSTQGLLTETRSRETGLLGGLLTETGRGAARWPTDRERTWDLAAYWLNAGKIQ